MVAGAALLALALYAKRVRKLKAEYEEVGENIRYAFGTYRQRLDSHEGQIEALTRSLNELMGSLRWLRGRALGQERKITRATEAAVVSLEASKRTLDHSLAMERRLKELELEVEKGRNALKEPGQIDSLRREVSALASQHEGPPLPVGVSSMPVAPVTPTSLQAADGPPARLTETELRVLDILTTQGAKTSRELEKVIGRTREHTARVMKKLYLEGYVDRDVHKLPYVYRVNEKLKAALQKSS